MEVSMHSKEKLTKYNIKINIVNGIAAIIAMNLVNPYFVKFAERIGANDYQIAALSSLPALVSVFAFIPGAILIESFKNKKAITGAFLFSHKVFYLLLALIPFVNKAYQPWLFVILVGLMNFPGSISAMAFQSSIGDVFDERTRGRAMGLRSRYSTIFGMIITFMSGQLLTRIPKTDMGTIMLYQIFFVIAFFIAQGEVFSYLKFKGVKNTKDETSIKYIDSLKDTLRSLPKHRNFLLFTGCSLIFHFGWQMGWPLYSIYTIKYLHANEVWLSAIAIASSISSIATYTLWAKFADKKGNAFALSVATGGMAITPFLYALSNSLLALVLFNVIIGVSVAGTVLILFNILLEVTPEKNRTIYLGIYSTLLNISATVSPMIGVAIMNRYSIYLALVVVGIFRFSGSIAFYIRSKAVRKIKATA